MTPVTPTPVHVFIVQDKGAILGTIPTLQKLFSDYLEASFTLINCDRWERALKPLDGCRSIVVFPPMTHYDPLENPGKFSCYIPTKMREELLAAAKTGRISLMLFGNSSFPFSSQIFEFRLSRYSIAETGLTSAGWGSDIYENGIPVQASALGAALPCDKLIEIPYEKIPFRLREEEVFLSNREKGTALITLGPGFFRAHGIRMGGIIRDHPLDKPKNKIAASYSSAQRLVFFEEELMRKEKYLAQEERTRGAEDRALAAEERAFAAEKRMSEELSSEERLLESKKRLDAGEQRFIEACKTPYEGALNSLERAERSVLAAERELYNACERVFAYADPDRGVACISVALEAENQEGLRYIQETIEGMDPRGDRGITLPEGVREKLKEAGLKRWEEITSNLGRYTETHRKIFELTLQRMGFALRDCSIPTITL